MSVINWQYTRDLNDINTTIQNHDSDWEGLTSADQIINITFDSSLGCYVVFWQVENTPEIIRCRECKYGEIDDPDFPDEYYCHYSGCEWNNGGHFCGYAKGKENNGSE